MLFLLVRLLSARPFRGRSGRGDIVRAPVPPRMARASRGRVCGDDPAHRSDRRRGLGLLPMLLDQGHEVRCLVRDPRRLGRRARARAALARRPRRSAEPAPCGARRRHRHPSRGRHARPAAARASRRSPRSAPIGCSRRPRRAGVRRFVFFSALGATSFQRTRFFRSKALAEERVRRSSLETTDLRAVDHLRPRRPWVTWMKRLALLPLLPISGRGQAALRADLGAGRREGRARLHSTPGRPLTSSPGRIA